MLISNCAVCDKKDSLKSKFKLIIERIRNQSNVSERSLIGEILF